MKNTNLQTKKLNFYSKKLNMLRYISILIFFSINLNAQFLITLKYKKPKCGGARNPDTTSYFVLSNKKWIIQYPSNKIDTIYTNSEGKITIPSIKGKYYLFDPWKYYKQTPSDFPVKLYDKKCLEAEYSKPDFIIQISSKKKYKISPSFWTPYCPDKHPCIRKDTIIPRIPQR